MKIQQDRIYITRGGDRARVLGQMIFGGWRIQMLHAPHAEYILCSNGYFSIDSLSTLDLVSEAVADVLQFDQSKRRGVYCWDYWRGAKKRREAAQVRAERKQENTDLLKELGREL